MKLIVVIDDAGMAANVGGSVNTYAKTFEMPIEIDEYIRSKADKFTAAHIIIEFN